MNQSPRILIVEDEAIIAQDLRATLENLGYSVANIVNNGDRAIQLLKETEVDVVLMDIRIKGDKNGIETTHIINQQYDIPVIFLTAFADVETMERIKGIDAYGFIVKPASEQTIQGSIDLALYKHALDLKLREREERLAHLNKVLLAIRNVHQLITENESVQDLIQGVCETLVESLGYTRAYIALYNGNPALDMFAYAGFNNPFSTLEQLLRGDQSKYPPCIFHAFGQQNSTVVSNTSETCDGCPLSKEFRNYSRFSKCLDYGGKVYGVMSVAVPSIFVNDEEEQQLFKELVDDVAFALHRIELEEKRAFAERMLKARERTLSTLMNNLPGMAYRCLDDERRTMKFISNGCKQLTGFYPIDLMNNKKTMFMDIVHPDDRESLNHGVKSSRSTSQPYAVTYRIITAEGETKWVWERGNYIGERDSGLEVIEGVIHDITEQKLAEEALKTEKAFTEMALNAQTDTFFVFDPRSGQVLRWNKQFETVTGYSGKEIMARSVPDGYYGHSDSREMMEFLRKMNSDHEGMIELALITNNGRDVPYEYRVTKFEDTQTGKPFYVTVGRDIAERRQNEKILKAGEEKLRNIIEHSNEIFFIHDKNQRLTFVSPQCRQILGYSIEEMMKIWPRLATRHPMNASRIKTSREALKTGKRAPCYTMEFRKKSGETIFVEIDESPLIDEKGCVIGMIGAVRDVSEQWLAIERLAESEFKFRTLFEYAGDGIYVVDIKNKRTVLASPSFCQLVGYSAAELSKINIRAIHPKKSFADIKRKFEALQFERLAESRDVPVMKKDGSIIWCDITGTHIEIAGKQCMMGFFRDVTERKEIEEALIQSESRYRAIVEDQTEFILRWLPNGIRTYANPAYCRYYNQPYPSLVGTSFFPQIHKKDLGRIKSKIKMLTQDHPLFTDEHRVILENGEIRWHQWTDRAIFDRKGNICEIQSVGRDVTHSKKSETELKRANVRMKAILENTDESIMIADQNGKLVMFNSAYENMMREMFHHEIETGNQPHTGISEVKIKKWWNSMHTRVLDGEKFSTELSCPAPDGKNRYFDIHYYPIIEENEVRGFTEFARDITLRKQTEQALRLGEMRLSRNVSELHAIINALPGLITVVDKEFNVLLTNDAACKIFGQSHPDEVLNKKCYTVRKNLKKVCPQCAIQRSFKTGKLIVRMSTPEENALMGMATKAYAVPLKDEKGSIWGGVEVIMDITDIKQAEKAAGENEK